MELRIVFIWVLLVLGGEELSAHEAIPILIEETFIIETIQQGKLSPAPDITTNGYESTITVIQYRPLVIPTKSNRTPNRKPSRTPPPPPDHLVAESLLPPNEEEPTTSKPELKPIPPSPPPIPTQSSQVHDVKESTENISLPPSRKQTNTRTKIPLLKYVRQEDGFGNYYFGFESGDSIIRTERGTLKKIPGSDTSIVSKKGYYRFLSPDGLPHRVDYVADERGYQPIIETFYVKNS